MSILNGLNFKAAEFLREFILHSELLQEVIDECAKEYSITQEESKATIITDFMKFAESLKDVNAEPYEVLDCIGDELADSAYPQMIVSDDEMLFTCYSKYVCETYEISLVHVTSDNKYIGTSISRKSKLVYFIGTHDTLS